MLAPNIRTRPGGYSRAHKHADLHRITCIVAMFVALMMKPATSASKVMTFTCEDGCSGETMAAVCGADGRTYQNECLAQCQNVAIVSSGPCDEHTGYALEANSMTISLQQIQRFQPEGFKLLGYGKARAFDPELSSSRNDAENQTRLGSAASTQAAAAADSQLQAVRFTAEGLVYAATMTLGQARDAAAAANQTATSYASASYIPPGMQPGADETAFTSTAGKTAFTGKRHAASRKLRYVFPPDDRKEITVEGKFPYSAIGRLTFENSAGTKKGWCSGAMISARSVLTAAHCVYNRDTSSWQKGWQFSANQHSGSDEPFGTAQGSYVTTFAGWTNSNTRNPWPYDMAVVQLSGDGATLGKKTGWLGLEYVASFNGGLNTAGYPGDKEAGTYWSTSCNVVDDDGTDGLIKNECDTYPGQSGSPMFVAKGGDYLVHGVVSFQMGSRYNGACEVTGQNLNKLMEWA